MQSKKGACRQGRQLLKAPSPACHELGSSWVPGSAPSPHRVLICMLLCVCLCGKLGVLACQGVTMGDRCTQRSDSC